MGLEASLKNARYEYKSIKSTNSTTVIEITLPLVVMDQLASPQTGTEMTLAVK